MKHLYSIFIISFMFLSSTVIADNLEKGWEAFAENRLDEAESYFKKATSSPASRAEAYAGLVLLKTIVKDEAGELEYFKKAMEYYPDKSALAFAMRESLLFTWSQPDLNEDRMEFMETLVKDPEVHGTLKASLYRRMGSQQFTLYDFKDSEESYQKVGAIKEWSTVGTFENISGSGFDKDWEPLTNPRRTKEFMNKREAPVNWEKVRFSDNGVWINLAQRYAYSNSLVFAQTFCESPDEREAIINVGTSGSIKVWLNDALIYSNDEERNNGMDTYSIKTKLNRGYNRILLQVGESDIIDGLNYNVRITDMDYNPMRDLSYDPFYQQYQKATNVEAEFLPLFAETYFEKEIQEEPQKLLNYLLLSNVYMRNDKNYEAREVLDKALEIAPECSYLRWKLAVIHSSNDNETDLNIMLEKLKEDDPDNPLSIILLLDEAIDTEDYEEAHDYLDQLETVYGKNHNYYTYKVNILVAESKQEELIETIEEAYDKYPLVYDMVQYQYAVEKEIENDNKAARKVLSKYLKKVNNESAMGSLAYLYFQSGDPQEGIDLFKERIENDPSAVGYISRLADVYHNMGLYSHAIKEYEKCLERAPYIGSFYAGIGQAYKEMEEDDNAIEAFETCLLYSPYSYEERRVLRELKGEKPAFEYFEEPDYYKIAEETNISQDDYPEDNSVILLDEVQKVIYKGGANEEMHYFMVKVLNPSGIDAWKDYYLPYGYYNNVVLEKAEVIKENGSKVKAERGGSHLVFTSLEEGDVLLVVYKLQNYSAGRLARHFWDQFWMSSAMPARNTSYKILTQGDMDFDYRLMQSDLKPTVEDKSGYKLYSWKIDKSESIKKESYMPSIVDIGQVLNYSSIPDWDYIAKWYYDLSESKIDANYVVKKTLEDLFPDGHEDMSDREKAMVLYDYIVKDIRYSSVSFRQSNFIPQKASKTIVTKIGDCKDVSTLFVTLAREVGLDAHLVLVNTRDNGEDDLVLPNPEFNHAIAAVMLDDKKYYVEFTSDLLPFSTFGQTLKNSFALDIIGSPDVKVEPQKLNPETRIENNKLRYSKVTFDGNNMIVEVETDRTGTYASYTRSTYRDIGDEMRRKNMTEAISSDKSNIRLNDLKFEESLQTTEDTVEYSYSYTMDNAFTSVGSMQLLKIPFADPEEPMPFTSATDRQHALNIWEFTSRDKFYERMEIELPEGKRLVERPQNIHYECDYAVYDLTFKLNGRKLVVERIFTLKDDVVPVENYEQFRDFYNDVVTADETQIGLR